MDAQAEHFSRAYGFGAGDADVLGELAPPRTAVPAAPQRVATARVVTSGAITGRIDRLAELGFVERSNSAVDRRGFEVRLTRRGYELREQLMRRIFEQGALPRALRKFSARERQTFDALLERLHTEMEHEVLNAVIGPRASATERGPVVVFRKFGGAEGI